MTNLLNQQNLLLLLLLMNGGQPVAEGEDTSWLMLRMLLLSQGCSQNSVTAQSGTCSVCEA